MKNNKLRNVILFGAIIICGLLVVQGYWIQRAFDLKTKDFKYNVQAALSQVAGELKGDSTQSAAIIENPSANLFLIRDIDVKNPGTLNDLIDSAFAKRSLNAQYEFGVFEADHDTLVYGQYINGSPQVQNSQAGITLPEHSNVMVYFPKKAAYLAGEMKIWYFFTLVLVLMIGFFAYAISQLLREKRLTEIKNDFINNMTHEFKTPVTNIEIASEVLKSQSDASEKVRTYSNIIHKENQKLREHVSRILEMSTVSKHHTPMEKELLNIHELLGSSVVDFQHRFERSNAKITLQFDARMPEIKVDKVHVSNVIHNILDNAEKYSKGYPEIDITTKNTKKGLEITISDHGKGIREDYQKMVFDRFFRVPQGDQHNVKGFGLGLSYAKGVVEAHKGKISLQSKENIGSSFTIYLPQN